MVRGRVIMVSILNAYKGNQTLTAHLKQETNNDHSSFQWSCGDHWRQIFAQSFTPTSTGSAAHWQFVTRQRRLHRNSSSTKWSTEQRQRKRTDESLQMRWMTTVCVSSAHKQKFNKQELAATLSKEVVPVQLNFHDEFSTGVWGPRGEPQLPFCVMVSEQCVFSDKKWRSSIKPPRPLWKQSVFNLIFLFLSLTSLSHCSLVSLLKHEQRVPCVEMVHNSTRAVLSGRLLLPLSDSYISCSSEEAAASPRVLINNVDAKVLCSTTDSP